MSKQETLVSKVHLVTSGQRDLHDKFLHLEIEIACLMIACAVNDILLRP